MISCKLEEGNGRFRSWVPANYPNVDFCPFQVEDLVGAARITAFSEDHLIILTKTEIFVHDLVSSQRCIVEINEEDRQTICAMIICALHPDGETDWDYADFEGVIGRLDLIRFIP